MSRLSRDKKRDHQRAERPAEPAAPIEVHVPGDAGPGSASVDGVRFVAAPGEEIQQTVLNHLHRIALTTAHEVHATIHDTRIGYVVPLRVTPNGSSAFRGEPVRMAPPGETGETGDTGRTGETGVSAGMGVAAEPGSSAPTSPSGRPPTWPEPPVAAPPPPRPPDWPAPTPSEPGPHEAPAPAGIPGGLAWPAPAEDPVSSARSVRTDTPVASGSPGPAPVPSGTRPGAPASADVPAGPAWPAPAEDPLPAEDSVPADGPETSVPADSHATSVPADGPETSVRSDAPAQSAAPAVSDAVRPRWAQREESTHRLRAVEEPVRDAVPTFPMRAVPEDGESAGDEAVPTFTLRALSEPPRSSAQPPAPAPGTVAAPTGVFGPPPVMDTHPAPAPSPEPGPMSTPPPPPATLPRPTTPPPTSTPTPTPKPAPLPERDDLDFDPAPKPTPPRGFDAVAEAVLGDEALTAPGDATAPALLAEPMGRINEAVKAGRTEDAAELAEQTLAQASSALGPEHLEVLRLRELTAYIAYLAGDPVRALHLSLDLARVHHDTRDAEAAYGNVQSAFTAWRAVRDPQLGLDLGHGLIALWTELAAEEGPAADDIEQLEKARARMGRLTERARDDG